MDAKCDPLKISDHDKNGMNSENQPATTKKSSLAKKKNCWKVTKGYFDEKPNIMLRNNVIYVDTICLFGLQGWSSDSINVASLSRANLLLRPKGVFLKRSMHSRIRSLLLSPSVVTSLRKKVFPSLPSLFAMSREIFYATQFPLESPVFKRPLWKRD